MKFKSLYFIVLIGLWITTIFAYLWFIKTPYFGTFNTWTHQNLILFYISLLLSKIIAIVWPPIPGSLLTLGAIPLIGWQQAFLIETIGGLTGASIAYFLGRKYGSSFLRKMFGENIAEKVAKIKIRKEREVESIFLSRIAGAGNLMELVCYGAGMLRVRFSSFLIASFLASLLTLPIFYIGGNILGGGNIFIGVIFGVITLLIFWKLKGRYIE